MKKRPVLETVFSVKSAVLDARVIKKFFSTFLDLKSFFVQVALIYFHSNFMFSVAQSFKLVFSIVSVSHFWTLLVLSLYPSIRAAKIEISKPAR